MGWGECVPIFRADTMPSIKFTSQRGAFILARTVDRGCERRHRPIVNGAIIEDLPIISVVHCVASWHWVSVIEPIEGS